MTAEVIVVPEAATEDDAGVAFAAGVATAEAAQAGEEAQEAAAVAEVAVEEAGAAVSIASEASSTAWAAREDVDQLRAEFGGSLEEIRGMIADLAVGGAADEGPLTPERVEREDGPAPEGSEGQEDETESKGGRKRYGNPKWFGGR